MSELRAPDPTLDSLGKAFVKVDAGAGIGNPIAHLWAAENDPGEYQLACGVDGGFMPQFDAEWARWFAVPCRECFPDAPEPGRRFVRDANGEDRSVTYEAGDLAWQVQP